MLQSDIARCRSHFTKVTLQKSQSGSNQVTLHLWCCKVTLQDAGVTSLKWHCKNLNLGQTKSLCTEWTSLKWHCKNLNLGQTKSLCRLKWHCKNLNLGQTKSLCRLKSGLQSDKPSQFAMSLHAKWLGLMFHMFLYKSGKTLGFCKVRGPW